MSLLSFVKDAGESLFGWTDADLSEADPARITAHEQAAAAAIAARIDAMGLKVEGLVIQYDSVRQMVTVSGLTPDQATREKVVLCCGNVVHVMAVTDLLVVAVPTPEWESKLYTVVQGDHLSKISKIFYETPHQDMLIFEANQPMLTHPDNIYVGQILRIPVFPAA